MSSATYQSLCYDGYDHKWILGTRMQNFKMPPSPAEPDPPPPPTPAEEKKEEEKKEVEKKEGEKKEEEKKEEEKKEEEKKEGVKEEEKKEEPPAPPTPPDPVKLKVPFCCEACEEKIRTIFRVLNGVESVKVDSESGLVTITGNVKSEECLNLAKKVAKRAAML